MKILVTGAAGFIGSHVVEALLRRGDAVVGVDNFDPFYAAAIKERNLREIESVGGDFHFVDGDLLDGACRAACFGYGAFDVVVHLAAKAGVRPSIDDPAGYFRTNLEATALLLQDTRRHGCQRVVFASSSSVYGADTTAPFAESARCDQPVSPYAASKRAGELLCHTLQHLHGGHYTCLRFFTVYGPRQRPEMAIHKFASLLWQGKPIPLFGDGSTSRDYTYVDDIVRGVLAAIDRPAGFAIVNLGGDKETRLLDLVTSLAEVLEKPLQIDWRPEAPGDVPRTSADLTHARALLGYQPQVDIHAGLQRFASWFVRHGERGA